MDLCVCATMFPDLSGLSMSQLNIGTGGVDAPPDPEDVTVFVDIPLCVRSADPEDLSINSVELQTAVLCETEIHEINVGFPEDKRRVSKLVQLAPGVPFTDSVVDSNFLTQIHADLQETTGIDIDKLQPLCFHVVVGYFGKSGPPFTGLADHLDVTDGDAFATRSDEWFKLLEERALQIGIKRWTDEGDDEDDVASHVKHYSAKINKWIERLKKEAPVVPATSLPVVVKRATVTFVADGSPQVLFKATKQMGESAPNVVMNTEIVNIWRSHQQAILDAPTSVQKGLWRLKETATPWATGDKDQKWWEDLSSVCAHFRDTPPRRLPDDMVLFQGKEKDKPHPSKKEGEQAYFEGYACFFDPYTTSPLIAEQFATKFQSYFVKTTVGQLRSKAEESGRDFAALWLSKKPFPIPNYLRHYLKPTEKLMYESGDRQEYEILCVGLPNVNLPKNQSSISIL